MHTLTGSTTQPPSTVYDLAHAYDIAFDFRNLSAECDVLDSLCAEFGTGRTPRSMIDICCGPGFHCIEYARRGVRSIGLDFNTGMLKYAAGKSRAAGARVEFINADMRDFTIERPVDVAFCAMSSIHHILTQDDILKHLHCVARSLTDSGLYVVEADHPRDVFGVGQSLKHEWESERDGIVVTSSWGSSRDRYDPISQIATVSVTMGLRRKSGSGAIADDHTLLETEEMPLRRLTYQELSLLIEMSQVFEPVAWLGSLEGRVPMSNVKESTRMIPVLKKLPHT